MNATSTIPLETARGCLSHLRTDIGRRRYAPAANDPSRNILDVRNPFVKDECKLINAKAFRLLDAKTQVATAPMNLLMRNRLTHTLEVVSHSVRLAEILGLNADLARSIALGHDIGHVPFGHQGEAFIGEAMGRPGFCHEVMGVIVAQKVERKGMGLNLTFETLEGMLCHSGSKAHDGMTQEAWVVRYADKIAYLFSDYNDMQRMGWPISTELHNAMNAFGSNQRERTMQTITALVTESFEHKKVRFEDSPYAKAFKRIRTLMYQIYPRITQQKPHRMMGPVLEFLQGLKIGDPFLLLALMTDKDVMYLADLAMPDVSHLNQTAVGEILLHLADIGPIDMLDPCLGW
jgi:dGTP triphosphohydrolase